MLPRTRGGMKIKHGHYKNTSLSTKHSLIVYKRMVWLYRSRHSLIHLSAPPLIRLSTHPLIHLSTHPLTHRSTHPLTHLSKTHSYFLIQLGMVTGAGAKPILTATGLATAKLRKLWELADIDKDGSLDLEEFVVAMFLADACISGVYFHLVSLSSLPFPRCRSNHSI